MNRRDLLKSIGGIAAAVAAGLGLSKVASKPKPGPLDPELIPDYANDGRWASRTLIEKRAAGPVVPLGTGRTVNGVPELYVHRVPPIPDGTPVYHDGKGGCVTADGEDVGQFTGLNVEVYPNRYAEVVRLNFKPDSFGSEQASVIVHDHTGKVIDRYDLRDGIRLMPGERPAV